MTLTCLDMRLCKSVWNEDKGQKEPGETIWSVPCTVEESGDEYHAALTERREIPSGEWFLVFPWQPKIYAWFVQNKTDKPAPVITGWSVPRAALEVIP